jgi:hypothetical protein
MSLPNGASAALQLLIDHTQEIVNGWIRVKL